MSSVSRYSDDHTLYVTSGAANNGDVVYSVSKALKSFERTSKKKYSCNIISNLVFDRDDIPYGFGYVYVSNTQVYNMLLGKNPDGSERTKIVEKASKVIFTPEDGVEWIEDWSKDERELVLEELPPLLIPPPHRYTPEQRTLFQKFITKINSLEKKHLHPDQFQPDICKFTFEKAHVKPVGEQYSLNILCGRKIPSWLDQRTIYNEFRIFVSDKRVKKKTRVKNRLVEVPYPEININRKKGLCFVEFNPLSRDAQFALLMTTKVIFKRANKPSQTSTVFFTHSFKNKRK